MPVELTDQIERAELAGASSDLRTMEDATLVAVAKKGEAAAVAMLVERHERRIFSAALRITRNREDAEDVVQLSFQKVFVHLDSFVGRSSFSTWLTRIAINEALMLLRKNHGSREAPINDPSASNETAFALAIPDSGRSPEESYSRLQQERILALAMEQLKPGTQMAIRLRDLHDRSVRETAQVMGISVAAVKSRVFHGRRKLRERLKHYFGSAWTSRRNTSRRIGDTRHILQNQVARNACG